MDIMGTNHIESMLMTHTREAEDAVIAFSRFLSLSPIDERNASLYQKILAYNHPEAVDALLKRRNPESLFSGLTPSRYLAVFAFSTLSEFSSDKLYKSTVLICLGIIQSIYTNPRHGVSLYSPSVTEIYHMAKYFKISHSRVEDLILDCLENISQLSGRNEMASISRKIMDTYFDNSKKIESIIPSSIFNS